MENNNDTKQEMADAIKDMFAKISGRYDLLNKILSIGIDKRWREKTAEALNLLDSESKVLDLACGTADLTIAIAKRYPDSELVGIDFVPEMIKIAEEKVSSLGLDRQIKLYTADALDINFPDQSFDAVTVAFGIRNFADLDQGLHEMARVTKSGGRLGILEFSQPQKPILKELYQFYFKYILPMIGGILSKWSAYKYLHDSVMQFVSPDEINEKLKNLGYEKIESNPLTFDICRLYTATKI